MTRRSPRTPAAWPCPTTTRDHRVRGRAGSQAVRQPDEVHPLRPAPAWSRSSSRSWVRASSTSRPASSFTSAQVLWIHFLVMRPRDRAGLRPGNAGPDAPAPAPARRIDPDQWDVRTFGLAGLHGGGQSAADRAGLHHYHSVQIGSSMGVTAFALMLIAAAYHCRSETGTILTTDTFNSRNLNLTAMAEILEPSCSPSGAFSASCSEQRS